MRCPDLSPPVNGFVACNVTDDEQRCFPTCPPGFDFESPIPAVGYYSCQADGSWDKGTTFPQCVENPDAVNPLGVGHFSGVYTNVKAPADQAGTCYTWGQHHYRTFDGSIFRFRGSCNYILAKDIVDYTYTVYVQNDERCTGSRIGCARSVIIQYGEDMLTLAVDPETGKPSAFAGDVSNGDKLFLPEFAYGLSIESIADYIIVKSNDGNLYVKWDGQEQVWVTVAEEMNGKTGGLCGTFNYDSLDDFTILHGGKQMIVDDVSKFANSWKGELYCPDAGSEPFCRWGEEAPTSERLLTGKALDRCAFILDSICADVVNPLPYYEACKEDVCFFNGDSDSPCNSAASYFRECSRRGVHVDWRAADMCPMSCPVGQVYDNCGTSCPQTCSGHEYNCEDRLCIDGCHCPEDSFLFDGECLKKTECPCQFGNTSYAPKTKIRRDCNQCVCARGKWVCTRNPCDGVCRTFGGNHYETFDGYQYNLRVDQDCSYVMARSTGTQDITFDITVEQKHGLRNVGITVNGKTVKMLSGGQVMYNTKEETLPVVFDQFAVEDVTSEFQKITIWNGMTILWDKKYRIFIRAKENMVGQMAGLCGNFNEIQDDDKWASDGITHEDIYEFASLWQTDICPGAPRFDQGLDHPCKVNSLYKPSAREICGKLRSPPFLMCHDVVDFESYYDSCMYQYCLDPTPRSTCEVFATYSLSCSKQGIVFDWRNEAECEVPTCPTGQIFKECSKSCESSCGAIHDAIPCAEECIPGCSCPEGEAMGYDGMCVKVEDCPCFFDDEKYMPGESHMQDCNVCECFRGKWECTDNVCPVNDQCGENEEFVECKYARPLTCFTMHLPLGDQEKPEHCQSGCQCKEGYVLDETTNQCVARDACPCFYGGRSYAENEEMRKDCNTCTCSGGKWTCTEKVCRGECNAYGATHITTFDGHYYKFGQACEYVLAQSTESSPVDFQVTVTNVPCGSYGTVCSKSITMMMKNGTQEHTLSLIKGKKVEVERTSPFTIREAGLYVFIDTPIGVTLQWDLGTYVTVKVEGSHASQVEGLCGNYDHNSNNDFVTRGGMETSDRLVMAESWQVGICRDPTSVDEVDGCRANPSRKAWAEARCSVLKNKFADCHSFVDYNPYYERCVFDTCASNNGGESDSFCTSVAAYAQECNRHGVSPYWRSQDMCPMQCDGYRNYNPCVTACPIDCMNFNRKEQVEAQCQDSCVEGCSCKGKLLFDKTEGCCIERSDCVCMVHEGISYAEGDKIYSMSDECKSCYCMDNEIHCLGLPCEE